MNDIEQTSQLPVHLTIAADVSVVTGDDAGGTGRPDEPDAMLLNLPGLEWKPPPNLDVSTHPKPRAGCQRCSDSDRRVEIALNRLGQSVHFGRAELARRWIATQSVLPIAHVPVGHRSPANYHAHSRPPDRFAVLRPCQNDPGHQAKKDQTMSSIASTPGTKGACPRYILFIERYLLMSRGIATIVFPKPLKLAPTRFMNPMLDPPIRGEVVGNTVLLSWEARTTIEVAERLSEFVGVAMCRDPTFDVLGGHRTRKQVP